VLAGLEARNVELDYLPALKSLAERFGGAVFGAAVERHLGDGKGWGRQDWTAWLRRKCEFVEDDAAAAALNCGAAGRRRGGGLGAPGTEQRVEAQAPIGAVLEFSDREPSAWEIEGDAMIKAAAMGAGRR